MITHLDTINHKIHFHQANRGGLLICGSCSDFRTNLCSQSTMPHSSASQSIRNHHYLYAVYEFIKSTLLPPRPPYPHSHAPLTFSNCRPKSLHTSIIVLRCSSPSFLPSSRASVSAVWMLFEISRPFISAFSTTPSTRSRSAKSRACGGRERS